MDVVTLSRIQFGVTTALHFLFVPLTLGMVWFVAIFQTLHYRTGEERYRRMAKFWGKLFLVNFGMGVVTGLVQEFQFGMNWSESVSYTHLTLPTSDLVEFSVVAVSLKKTH